MTSLSSINNSRDIRKLGINLNHWYVVAQISELKNQPLGVTLWNQPIVIYRDNTGKIQALEDRCPHRQVKLSHGKLINDQLECAYHGWRFNAAGECAEVPYLAANQKLPTCKIRHYPVIEKDGFIWVFPGDETLSNLVSPLALPEWDHLNYIVSYTGFDCPCHYSFLIENLMDMYHGHLHQDLQAWANPVLQHIDEDDNKVHAHYQAQSYYRINREWAVLQLFIPALRQLHPEPLDVSYIYPHWVATLGEDFKICCLFCPVNETTTRAYLIHFTSLNAFDKLHILPVGFRRFVKNISFNAAKGLLNNLVLQDLVMIEEEQQAYLQHPERKNYELNKALVSVQKLIRSQVEKLT
ncbi:MAG: aromatic ring-hydroxylating dioxygenase subunit alpha [Phormidium sp.]